VSKGNTKAVKYIYSETYVLQSKHDIGQVVLESECDLSDGCQINTAIVQHEDENNLSLETYNTIHDRLEV
jgi:hypothetical protein